MPNQFELNNPALRFSPRSAGAAKRHLGLRLFEFLAQWQQRSQERYRLLALSDHQLKDIGVSRADIELEASKPFWRP